MIKDKNSTSITCDSKDLKLFLAKTDGGWMRDVDPAVLELTEGRIHPDVQTLIDGKRMGETWSIKDVLEANDMATPQSRQVHVLVVVPSGEDIDVGQDVEGESKYTRELRLYQQRGNLIKVQHADYCGQILDKIDQLYEDESRTLPFICVEGSSGMGKTQLAFALGGRRPWFYWPATRIGSDSQNLYQNFDKISDAFDEITLKDKPMKLFKAAILNSNSKFYKTELLWTYGFILALLKQYSLKTDQSTEMIRFVGKTLLRVDKCNRAAVTEFCASMKSSGKVLPFFILDEMTPNTNMDGGGMNMAAFQRNVFRTCGLVVIVMGTDAKITNLIDQSGGSYKQTHMWMTIVPRFPPNLPVALEDRAKQAAWKQLVDRFPVLDEIVMHSRGRFARYFVDSVAESGIRSADINLSDLLDAAFDEVSRKTQFGKDFMNKKGGPDAQLMAMSYSNARIDIMPSAGTEIPDRDTDSASEPALKKRRLEVGTKSMHLHFANLMDNELTDVQRSTNQLHKLRDGKWVPWRPLCCFPAINEDVLLYLAVLGGKKYSGYYDRVSNIPHSTLEMFQLFPKGTGFATHKNPNALAKDFNAFENMVAQSIFCASRKKGVRGILFDDFFVELLREMQDKPLVDQMEIVEEAAVVVDLPEGYSDLEKIKIDDKAVDASDLLKGYDDLAYLRETRIPFLAPPNATWPEYILDTHATRTW
ncbi:hypothetical protein PF003_g20690 [Phytophthora fragariae]|nr:hypothetical protein PF003_g20690 [Phytophthora fragariae]